MLANNGMQLTALRAAADAERSTGAPPTEVRMDSTSRFSALSLVACTLAVTFALAFPASAGDDIWSLPRTPAKTDDSWKYTAPPPSPCADSLFVSLKRRPIAALNDHDFAYFSQKDAACWEYQKLRMQAEAAAPMYGVSDSIDSFRNSYVGLTLGILAAVVVLSLVAANKAD